ncbi:hypothetical protein LIER_19669 [Lithospermum erythrorhizon]|uniref:Uncharacterized protein n=1 Tax=Lithospermum erythrorhizon TaxID=34254 RepID=A0AAV3QJI0_LITER
MMTALEARDKLGFLSGEIEEPEVNSVRHKQWRKLGTGGADGEERVMQFLMGLNEDYDNIRNRILTMDPILTVSKSYSMVSNVEKQRKVHHMVIDSADNMALSVQMAQGFKPASQTT